MSDACESKPIESAISALPHDYSLKLSRGEQKPVYLYCDMSSMLFYKAMLGTASEVSINVGKTIQLKNIQYRTMQQERAMTEPVRYESISLYNPQKGFASFLVPAILILLIQQVLLLGAGMLTGTYKDVHIASADEDPEINGIHQTIRVVTGKAMCYLIIFAVVAVWLLRIVPIMFHLPMIGNSSDLLLFLFPYLLAVIFFSITLSGLVENRETPMLLFVFTSVPLLFLSGVSWPQAAIPEVWKWFSYIFPSTFGIQGFIKISTMGGTIHTISREWLALMLQCIIYFTTACLAYHHLVVKKKQRQ